MYDIIFDPIYGTLLNHSAHRFHRDGISIDSGSGFIPVQSALFYHGSAVIARLRLDRIPLSEVEYR